MAKNSIKDYFSICPIVQDQTREPNEEPEDLCKLKFCLCYSRITMLRVPDNLNIKTSYNQNIECSGQDTSDVSCVNVRGREKL